jgi:hypothetical protein
VLTEEITLNFGNGLQKLISPQRRVRFEC